MDRLHPLEYEDIVRVAGLPYDWTGLDDHSILISGGTGFIGTFLSNVIRYRNRMLGTKTKIISLSRHEHESDDTVTCLKTDITRPIPYDKPVDYMIHLASNTHPKQYGEDPVGTITTNIIGCYHLLESAKNLHINRFVLASSVEIYGQGLIAPMDESYCGYLDCNRARAGYNESKRTCEALCQSYRSQYNIDNVICRFARVFGPDRKPDTKAMSQFMDKAVSGEDIILKSKGNQRYSYVYIADAVSGLIRVLLDGQSGEAYNITDDDEGKMLGEYAEYLAGLANKQVIYQIEDDASVSKATYAIMDGTKLKSLGWSPLFQVSEGLRRTYDINIANADRSRNNVLRDHSGI